VNARLLLLIAAMFVISFALARAGDYADLQAQVTAANDRYAVAAMHRDAATIAADYEKDGMFVSSKGMVLKGRDAVRKFYAQRLAHVTLTAVHCATSKLKTDGTMAWEYGSCTSTARTAHGTRTASGSYLTVWHKDADGKWRIAANMA
jgi:uncharacterized protein (TIGR02246 family)